MSTPARKWLFRDFGASHGAEANDALLGARFARRLGNVWLGRIYLTAVWLLGLKTLFFDVFKHHESPAPVANPN